MRNNKNQIEIAFRQRDPLTEWLEKRVIIFEHMTWLEGIEFTLREVEERFACGRTCIEEVNHWQSRLEYYRNEKPGGYNVRFQSSNMV